jgi:hypothetical protein
MLLVAWPRPEPFSRALRWVLQMETLGVAGFGWGAGWLEEGGGLRLSKHTGRFNEDVPAQTDLAEVRSERFMVHLRRPSRLSTISIEDTQPFLSDSGFGFCHNGGFTRHVDLRPRYEHLLQGLADSEVGFRFFEEAVLEAPPTRALEATHRELEGHANLGYLGPDGTLLAYQGHPHNDLWEFSLEGARLVSTALHSADESLFDLIFRGATDRRRLSSEVVKVGAATGARSS